MSIQIEMLATGVVVGAIANLAYPFILNFLNKLKDKFKQRKKHTFIIHFQGKDGLKRTITIETSGTDVALTNKSISDLIKAVGGEDDVTKIISE